MAGNSWQQPVAGEPSVGTPHVHYAQLYTGDPADTNWHSIDLTAQVPVGTKAIDIEASIQETAGVSRLLSISNASGGTAFRRARTISSQQGYCGGLMPISADYKIWWYVDNADVDNVTINMVAYYI